MEVSSTVHSLYMNAAMINSRCGLQGVDLDVEDADEVYHNPDEDMPIPSYTIQWAIDYRSDASYMILVASHVGFCLRKQIMLIAHKRGPIKCILQSPGGDMTGL